jgi:hypothetical protein
VEQPDVEIDMDYLKWQHNFLNTIRAPLNLTTKEFTFSYFPLYNERIYNQDLEKINNILLQNIGLEEEDKSLEG